MIKHQQIEQLEFPFAGNQSRSRQSTLITERERICSQVDRYVTESGIKYVPIEVLKSIIMDTQFWGKVSKPGPKKESP